MIDAELKAIEERVVKAREQRGLLLASEESHRALRVVLSSWADTPHLCAEVRRLRAALAEAQDTIHDEFCAGDLHAPECDDVREALNAEALRAKP